MSTAPTWQAPTSGQAPLANHVNQLLGAHACVVNYGGVQTDGQTTSGASTTSTNGLWLAQSFTTSASQTTLGHISLSLTTTTTTGASLAPTTVSIRANNAGAPAATDLVAVTCTAEYAYNGSGGGVTTSRSNFPLPLTGMTPSTTYWIVVAAAGNVSNSYTLQRSTQTSGASTSANGTTWTAQAYGFTFTVRDASVSGTPQGTYEDDGARWTVTNYNSSQRISSYYEYTAGQTTSGYMQSSRGFTYNTWLPTNIA